MKRLIANTWLVLKVVAVRLRFVLVFVLVGVTVANWDRIMDGLERWTRSLGEEDVEEASGREHEWFCPMHPSVVRKDPGAKCPICGMPLARREKLAAASLPAGIVARIELSPERVAQAGIATADVAYRPLVKEIRTVGFVAYDERRLGKVSARVAGRADELHVDFTGVRVRAGEPLYRLYSPDLVTTQEEYLLAARSLARSEDGDDAARERARRLAGAARERLLLWGVTKEQIEALEKSGKAETHLTIYSPLSGVVIEKEIHAGHYVEVGENPYTVADDSVVWVQMEVFERDIALVEVGQMAEIAIEAYPGESFSGRIAFIEPQLRPETRTLRVRADVENPAGKLKPGLYATVTLRVPLGKRVEVAGDAAPAAAPAAVYVCDMHPEKAFTEPGTCLECGGMTLEERELPPDGRLVYACPDHPAVQADGPGACSERGCARQLAYRIVSGGPESPLEWRCPEHTSEVRPEKATCPRCGEDLRPYRHEAVLSVPVSAVVDSGMRQVVFIARGGGIFESVAVTLGPRAGEHYQVLAGLKAGERVAAAGAFLLDAETRLHPASRAAYFGASGHETHGGER
jgi:Cu(I)/Ag(I) efflux system membrane fusion protein